LKKLKATDLGKPFAGGHHLNYKLENIGSYYTNYRRLMDHWHEALPGKILTVHYEGIVADADNMLHKLLELVGVPSEEACVSIFEDKRPMRTASGEQVRQPTCTKAVGHCKNFESHLEPLAGALGEETLARFE